MKNATPKRATSVDVARRAGVSQSTVSRAFNDNLTVDDATRQKVMAAARELFYSPNAIAKSLVSNTTNLVGVIVEDFTNPFYASFVRSISDKLNGDGKKVLLFSGTKSQNIDEVLRDAMSFRVDGLIIASSTLSQQLDEKSIPTCVPVTLINRKSASKNFCSIASDDVSSGRMVADLFQSKGFTRFAFIAGCQSKPSSVQRQEGYLNRLSEWGYGDFIVEQGEYDYQSGYQAMRRIMERDLTEPCAVFCANDLMAIGALDAIRENGRYRVPEDFALVGFDDIEISAWQGYRLTTLRQPVEAMLNMAFSYMESYAQDNNPYAGRHMFPCEIIERATT